MHLALAAVLEFHKKMAQTIGDPRNPDITREQEFRMKLIREELDELTEALEAGDTVKTADGIADLIYVLTGAAVTWGIDIASVFDEVHRSNMTKKLENKRSDGKVLKDADFSPPDIQGVLDEVASNFDCSEDGWWEEPSPKVSENIMLAAKEQAKILADENYPLQEAKSWEQSDGIPKPIQGEFTSYGAYVFDCSCSRRHAVQARLGSRGGMAQKGTCECICGKAYVIHFGNGESRIVETTIEDLRKS